MQLMISWIINKNKFKLTGGGEYTVCISAEGQDLFSYKCLWYDIKPSDGEAPTLELWGIWSTPSLSLLLGPLLSGVVAPGRFLSMGQIELFDHLNCMQTNKLMFNC